MIDAPYRLEPFRALHAEAVAGWVVSRRELFWMAPLSSPPLTPEKVRAWTAGAERGYVYLTTNHEPIAYGELNPMPDLPGDLWIGHFVVAPRVRGRNVGRGFLGALLNEAFARGGAHTVALVVFPENLAAIRCYNGIGFVDAGRQRRRFPGSLRSHELRYMKISRQRYCHAADRPATTFTRPAPSLAYV